MATNATSVRRTIERDLTRTIKAAVATTTDFLSNKDILSAVIDTIRDIRGAWELGIHSRDDKPESRHILDKTHFVYTAALRLNRFRDRPDALPVKIIACFTNHIKAYREVDLETMEDILSGAEKVEKSQERKIKKLEKDEMAATKADVLTNSTDGENKGGESTGKKRKADADPETDQQEAVAGVDQVTVSKPKRKKSKKAIVAPSDEADAAGSEDAGQSSTITSDSEASSPKASDAKSSSPSDNDKVTKKKGSGNYNTDAGVKWYPDEQQYMVDCLKANPKQGWKAFAAANAAAFKGTQYVDLDGVTHPGVRRGRTAESLRQRFRELKYELGGAQPRGATKKDKGGTNRSEDSSAGGAEDSDDEEAFPSGRQSGTSGGGKVSGEGSKVKGKGKAKEDRVARASNAEEGTSDAAADEDDGTGPAGNGSPAPTVIYASGKMYSGNKKKKSKSRTSNPGGEVQQEEETAGGEGADPARSEPGEDESPLEDLEQMAEKVDAGEL